MQYPLHEVRREFFVDAFIALVDEVRPQGYYFSGELHDFWEMVYIKEGFATITADGRVYDLAAGDLFLHKPMEFHRIWSAKDSAPHLLLTSFHATGDMRRFEGGFYTLSDTQSAAYEKMAGIVKTAIVSKRSTDFHHAAALLETFLLELPESVSKQSPPTVMQQRFYTAVKVMKQHVEQMLSVEEIAVLAGMSTANLKFIFAQFADCGVSKYFLTLKMRKARELLQNGLSAAQVAAALGYTEAAYFCTVFRRETGMTTGAYRKSVAKNESFQGILSSKGVRKHEKTGQETAVAE